MYTEVVINERMIMKWEDKLLIASIVVFVLAFPITAGYIEALVNEGLNYWVDYRVYLLPTLGFYMVGWFVYKYKTSTKLKIPKKTTKTTKSGMKYE